MWPVCSLIHSPTCRRNGSSVDQLVTGRRRTSDALPRIGRAPRVESGSRDVGAVTFDQSLLEVCPGPAAFDQLSMLDAGINIKAVVENAAAFRAVECADDLNQHNQSEEKEDDAVGGLNHPPEDRREINKPIRPAINGHALSAPRWEDGNADPGGGAANLAGAGELRRVAVIALVASARVRDLCVGAK